jgi:hypothetical protein
VNTTTLVTENLCVGTAGNQTCITKDQLDMLLSNMSNNSNMELSAPPSEPSLVTETGSTESGTVTTEPDILDPEIIENTEPETDETVENPENTETGSVIE